jgi:hypothetical protein
MTRDNLEKRYMGKPTQCEFFCEPESITHLFFHCIVAREIWTLVSIFLKVQVGTNYKLLELCPRGNNKDVIIIILVHDNVYIPC